MVLQKIGIVPAIAEFEVAPDGWLLAASPGVPFGAWRIS
jgi:hypothetical protein